MQKEESMLWRIEKFHLLLCMFVFFLTIVSCYAAEETKTLQGLHVARSWTINEKVVAASFDNRFGKLILASKHEIHIIQPVSQKIDTESIDIPDLECPRIICRDNICWLGGGSGYKDGKLISVNLKNGSINQYQDGNYSEINSLLVFEDRHVVITGHGSGQITLWDTKNYKKRKEFGDYDCEVYALEFSGDENKVYAGDDSGVISIWDYENGKKMASIKNVGNGSIYTVTKNESVNFIVAGDANGNLLLFDEKRLAVKKKIKVSKEEAILSCDLRSSDKKIVCGLTNGKVGIVSSDGLYMRIYKLHKKHVIYVKFINNGTYIVSVSKDGTVHLWDSSNIVFK